MTDKILDKDGLSYYTGKVKAITDDLSDRIENISSLGRYLSTWICPTGLAGTNPPHSPFEYRSGDYFLVSYVAQAGQTNYRPSGTTYTTGVASTVVETDMVAAGDRYLYDGTQWILQKVAERTVSFNNVAGSPYDNTNLSTALNGKQPTLPTGTTGHYLQKTASGVQWSAVDALQNTATGNNSLTIDGEVTTANKSINIGYISEVTGNYSTAIGVGASATQGSYSTSIGFGAQTKGSYSTSIGYSAMARADYTIQLGCGISTEANSFYVGLSSSSNYKLLGSDGKIPAERLTNALPTQSGQSGKFLTTNGTSASWSEVEALPSQTGHSGSVLTTNGTNASWTGMSECAVVIESKRPTSADPTWYRKYSDGWVEQGGNGVPASPSTSSTVVTKKINLIIAMQDNNYNAQIQGFNATTANSSSKLFVSSKSQNNFVLTIQNTIMSNGTIDWEVKGYAAQ